MKGIITIVILLAIYAGALLWKGSVVDAKKAQHFPSIYELHQTKGVPVYTEKVIKGKFEQLLTVTGKFEGNVFKASVTPQDRSKVSPGQVAIIEAGDEKTRFSGKVSKISSGANLLTGLIEIEITFPQNSKLTGFHTADLTYNARNNVLIVSRDSVNLREGKPFVYVLKGDKLEKRSIKITGSNSLIYQVTGVNEGEEIVSSDTRNLSDGLKIKVVNELRNNL